MPAYLRGMGSLSTKIVSIFEGNLTKGLPRIIATVLLNDHETGDAVAVMDGTYITALRTGAVGGLAAKYLSREDSRTVGIFGAGNQARTQLLALKEVREIDWASVYDTDHEKAKAYANMMAGEGMPVHVSVNPDEIVKSDILITVTSSKTPVFSGKLLKPGTHINAFGSFRPTERELDDETVRKSRVIVDMKEAALAEAGDLIIPLQNGVITETHILAELGEIVKNPKIGRKSNVDITLFKSVGLALQDSATAWIAYTKAKDKKIGQEVDLRG